MSCSSASDYSGEEPDASNDNLECNSFLNLIRDTGNSQPLCSLCRGTATCNDSNNVTTLCSKCKWQATTGLPGVNFTHTPFGGKTVPLSSASLASKAGCLSREERKQWQNTIKAELSKPRFKIGDRVVPIDNVGWGRTIKKQDEDPPSTSPSSHGRELSERLFGRYLEGLGKPDD